MHDKASLALGVAVMMLSGWGFFSALAWPWKAALFPLVISAPLFFLAAIEVLWALAGPAAKSEAADFKLSDHLPREVTLRRTGLAIGWILGFFAAIVLLGFLVAVPLFVLLYLKLQGVWGLFYALFDRLLHLPFPDGWIQTWIGLT